MANDTTGPANDADTRRYERVGKFVYAFHRTGASPDALRAIGESTDTPADLAQRASELAQSFGRIVNRNDSVSDAEIESALREAGTVQALIDDWQRQR